MNNITLLVTLENGDASTVLNFKKFLIELFTEKNYQIHDNNNIIKVVKDNSKIIMEFRNINNSKNFLFNIFYNLDFNKKEFLLELRLSQLVVNHIIVFDNGSNAMLQKNSKKIIKLENLIKYYVAYKIAHFHAEDAFEIINNFKVKEDLNEKFNNQISSIQRIELKNLIEYLDQHRWGGKEIEIIREYYFTTLDSSSDNSDEENEKLEEIKAYIENNIFQKLIDIISSSRLGKILYEWRNSIAHNKCIEEEIFDNISKKIDKIIEKIESLLKQDEDITNNFGTKFDFDMTYMPSFSYLIKTQLDSENVLLRLIEKLNYALKVNLLSSISKSGTFINENNNICVSTEDVKIILIKLEPEIIGNTFNQSSYQINIYMKPNENIKISNTNYLINNLFNEICDKFIVMYDFMSEELCDDLYVKINRLENLVRGYIKLNEEILINNKKSTFNKNALEKMNLRVSIDTEILKLKTIGTSIDLVNNELFDENFIDLLEKISNPLAEKKYYEIIKNEETSTVDDFNKKIADLSALDDNIKSIKDKWKELYRIRTMVAHNYIIYYNEYKDYLDLYIESLLEIKESIYNLYMQFFNKYYFELNISLNSNTELIVGKVGDKYNFDFIFDGERISYEFYECYITDVLNKLLKLSIPEDSLILSNDFVEFSLAENIRVYEEYFNSLNKEICIEILEPITNGNLNHKRVESENYRILEDSISELLKYISNELY